MSTVVVRALESAEECHAVAVLFGEIWATPNGAEPFPGEVLVALADSGNYVVGAYDEESGLVGAAAGWLGHDLAGIRFDQVSSVRFVAETWQ